MKAKIGEIRNLIKEEMMVAIPEHQFRTVVSDCVEEVRQLLRRNILIDKSKDSSQRQNAFNIANKVLKEFEKEVYDLLQDKLSEFDRNS